MTRAVNWKPALMYHWHYKAVARSHALCVFYRPF